MPFCVYTKEVKGKEINRKEITSKSKKENFLRIIDSLLKIGTTKYSQDLDLKEWILDIVSRLPDIDDRDIKNLLSDFTDSMYTRMREEEKYVIAILMRNSLILCHSVFGEKTITPNLQIIERMLDKDNVIRYVFFKKENDEIKIIFYEETKSTFFTQWLGLPEKEAFSYLGGKNRIFTEVNDTHLVFEFTDEEFEKKVIEGDNFFIEGNQIVLKEPIKKLPITQIRVGKKPYKYAEDFIQDFLAKRYDLNFYQEEYNKLTNTLEPRLHKIFDDENEVRSDTKIYIKKRNKNFIILFCNEQIELRKSYLEKIKAKILNKESIKLFHAGMVLNSDPIKLRNLEIYNKLDLDNFRILIDYYNFSSVKDNYELILLITILELLSTKNKEKPIYYFLKDIKRSLLKEVDLSSHFIKNEDYILEFKSRDFMSGNDKKIVGALKGDIEKKLRNNPFKIYVLGADEDTKRFELLSISKFSDERVSKLKTDLEKELIQCKMDLLKIPSKDGKECILICCVSKNES